MTLTARKYTIEPQRLVQTYASKTNPLPFAGRHPSGSQIRLNFTVRPPRDFGALWPPCTTLVALIQVKFTLGRV